ncbi:cupin domain-containing protein [Caldilinea sp.]|uniref:cupin domain-containing protein n=1 Tax=Caldilinea sp. TaxID=2293560 RepID=UPI002C213FBF|nr:cupin domain-containing protein [Anaerolineales bacterium]HQY91737.1 cupin domain-containing protein [Caldilinea sp.]
MAYKPSPRPTFEEPTLLRYDDVARHLWGDPDAGQVADWIYVSSSKIHQIVWGLAPGGSFRHSAEFRTIFGADLIYYVLQGTMVIANPETGEVQRVQPGEAAFFRKDTWHHAFNYSREPLRVLEFFAPPPSQGTSGVYARTRPLLTENKYGLDNALGRWPMARDEIERAFTIALMREADLLWRYEGCHNQVLIGLLCATEHLTVGKLLLLPGQKSDPIVRPGDTSLYLLQGTLNIFCPDKSQGPSWFELRPQDGFFAPAQMPHQFHNMTDQPVELLFGVAPEYV